MKRFLRHFFVPHESNNHRAKILHHSSLISLIVLLLVGSFALNHVQLPSTDILGLSSSINPQELLALTNQKRQDRGLAPLILDSQLSQAAVGKAGNMLANNYWAHIGPDGTTPWVFIKGSGYEYTFAGENLARGFTTSGDVINAWMDSPTHRDNMLSPNYSDIGFAIVSGNLTGEETVLVVEMFGNRKRSVAQEIAVAEVTPVQQPVVTTETIPPSITPVVTQAITPTSTPIPTPSPVIPTVSILPTQEQLVAAFQNQPLVNKPALQHNIAFAIVFLILAALIIDVIVIHRRNVVRVLSHNLDHIIFIAVLLLVIILISRGLTL